MSASESKKPSFPSRPSRWLKAESLPAAPTPSSTICTSSAATANSTWPRWSSANASAPESPRLKVRFNSVFGYYLEISKSNLQLVPPDYERRQTLVNAERFSTPELKEYEAKILDAEEKLVEIERRIFAELRSAIAGEARRIRQTAAGPGRSGCARGLFPTRRPAQVLPARSSTTAETSKLLPGATRSSSSRNFQAAIAAATCPMICTWIRAPKTFWY